MEKLIGYQIVTNDGKNDIPSCFFSFEVFSNIRTVEQWIVAEKNNLINGKFRWVILPIFDGDVEEPTFINF